jgi:prepilin-type N-terminal cleavage/methylation domain-containing protein
MENPSPQLSLRGFSLIEALVVVSILGIAGLAMMTLAVNTMKVTATADSKFDVVSTLDLLRMQLSNRNLCSANLGGKGIIPTSAGALAPTLYELQAGSNSVLSTNPLLKFLKSELVSLKVQSTSLSTANKLVFLIHHKTPVDQDVVREIPIAVQVNGSGEIIKCSASVALPSQALGAPISTLSNYHDQCTTCPQFMASSKMYCDSACNRYCGLGCAAVGGNCVGVLPGHDFAGGLMIECGSAAGGPPYDATCLCMP